jgi:glycosyltransferase involved in cell wall biosynthesis
MNKRLAIVPAYNESRSIAHVLEELRLHAPEFDVLVVDDGSIDDTAAQARAAGAQVLQLPFNLGIGGAVQTGYRYAAEHGYDLAVQVDGDGQHDARHLAPLAAFLEERPDVDLVVGTRFLESAEGGYQSSPARRVGIGFFARMLSAIVGSRVSDPTSGLRMTRRRAIELFARDYPHDYPEVEALLMVHAHRLKSAELPVVMRPRLNGASSITPARSVYYVAKVLVAVLIGLLRRQPAMAAGGHPLP